MTEIVHLHDEEGFSYSAISDSVKRRPCEYQGREFRNSAFVKREWGPSKCRRAYFACKRILEEEVSRLLRWQESASDLARRGAYAHEP